LLSITNVRGPKKISTDITIEGVIVGKCFTGDYLVLFTCGDKDRIYRIDVRRISNIKVFLLYEGSLGFSLSKTYDTTFYYENSIIQKVYWVESWQTKENGEDLTNPYYTSTSDKEICNFPRVINIITEGERLGKAPTQYTENIFDFYPEIDSAPTFKIKKDYNIPSEHPSGLIQYFISYYFDNGAETLIASNSSTFVVGHYNRGAKTDETGACGFKLTIKNIDTKFDYFRVYSAIRTSKDGPLLVKIVNDVKINKTNKNASYVLTDTGINQETLEASHLYFIGGTPFYANTLE